MFWIRDVDVFAGGKKFESLGDNGLDIEFDINFGDSKEPDVSEITIYNLSDDSINQIKKDGYCLVNAGYKQMGNKANILTGDIEEVATEWSGVDKLTKIRVSDGGKKWRQAKISKTYREGTKASLIMLDVIGIMGYEIVEVKPKEDKVYKLGKTVNGFCSDILKMLVKDTKSKMFVNKNRIFIRDEKKGAETGFVLSPETGLIGSPTLNKNDTGDKSASVGSDKDKKNNKDEKKTWNVVSLLNPKLETDSLIEIRSRALSGKFRVKSGKHTKDFNTEIVVEEV
nr:MAG TPA_asm: major tail protein [Caudoviricetes sp.]